MPGWAGSDRRSHLPADWEKIRAKRFQMDQYQCTATDIYGVRCLSPAEECDHIGSRDDHRLEMLRSLCTWHHGKKSGQQGAQAAARKRRQNGKKFLRTEGHPGLI